MFQLGERSLLSRHDHNEHPDHADISERFRKTLYYGKTPKIERPSLPLTELAVEFCQDASRREFGKVDTYVAASMGRQACMSPCSMVLGMLYIDRLKKKNPNYLRKVCSSDLFLISMMMASKYSYDEGVDEEVFNDEWAESANLDTEDVNDLEIDFLTAMDWGLFVGQDEFQSAVEAIEKQIAIRQGKDRNWFSYTDLLMIFNDPQYWKHWQTIRQELFKVFMACSVTYLASVLTMVGSVIALSYVSAGISAFTPILLSLSTSSLGKIPTPERVLPPISVETSWSSMEGIEMLDFDNSSGEIGSDVTSQDSTLFAEEPVKSFVYSLKDQPNVTMSPENHVTKTVFPNILAVMTLKNALVSLVSAVSYSDSPGAGNSGLKSQLPPLSCSTGVCSKDVKSTCLNLFLPRSLNYDANTVSRKNGARNCCNQCKRNLALKLNKRQENMQCKADVLNSVKDKSTEVRCCCQVNSQFKDHWTIFTDPFPDITLGFHTRTLTPLMANI